MSSSNRERANGAPPAKPVVPRTDAAPAFAQPAPDTYTNWLDRTQRARAPLRDHPKPVFVGELQELGRAHAHDLGNREEIVRFDCG